MDKPFPEVKPQIKRYKKYKNKGSKRKKEAVRLTVVNMHNYSYREKIVWNYTNGTLDFTFQGLVLQEGDYCMKDEGKRTPIKKDDFEGNFEIDEET